MTTSSLNFTVPGVAKRDADRAIELLQFQLNDCNRLQLTLKHVHWNVVGPNFIAVHEMLDPQIDAVRAMADQLAERIATLGGSPNGTPAAVQREGEPKEYVIGRAATQEHLQGLDLVYRSVITSHRVAVDETEALDVVTQDLLVGQLHELELFHWFVRAHIENASGQLATDSEG